MSALSTLLAGMADGQAKRLSLVSEDTAYANAQPTTKTEFDFDGATWATNGDITVGSGSPDPEATWGSAATSDIDGYTVMVAGGHGDSGRNALMALDVQAAAANINGGGSGIAWARNLRGARFIAGALARPSSGTSPTGAQQIAADPAQGPAYWTMPSLDGVVMPCVVHPWHSNKFAPGTDKLFLSGGSGFADNQSSSNAGFYWKRSSNTMNGPLVALAGAPAHCTVAFGYVGGTEGPSSLAISPSTGRIVTINNIGNFAWKLTYWSDPDNAAIALNDTGSFDPSLAPFDNADAIIIPDPADPTKEIYFQHGGPQGSGTDANFLAWSDIWGTPTPNWCTYSGSNPTTAGPIWNHYAWDAKRGVIWIFDGAQIFFVTPSPLGLSNWTISAALSLTGDAFTSTAGSGAILPSIQYVAADDALIVSTLANTLVVRPPNWSVAGGTTFPWIFWGLDAWSLVPTGGETISGSVNLDSLSLSSALKLIDKVSGTVALPILTLSSSIKLLDKISGSLALASVALSSSLRHLATVSGSVALPILTLSSSIKLIGKISGTVALPPLTLASSLKLIDKISGSVALPILTLSSSLTVGGTAHITGSLALPSVALTSALKDIAKISGTVALPVLTLSSLISTGNPSALIPDTGFIVNTGRLMNR